MDYEKKYNEAVKIARCWLNDPQTIQDCNYTIEDAIQNIFPQLRESEDERIRKEMIAYFAHRADVTEFIDEGEDCKRWISYLEKQKEPKPNIELIQRSWYMEGYHDREFDKEPKWIIKTGEGGPKHELNPRYGEYIEKEQNPVEKQDYSGLNELERAIHRGFLCAGVENVPVGIIKETVQDCLAQMKPAEWSEEDEDMLNCCISSIEEAKENRYAYKETDGDTSYDREIAFLKSLRPSWKPSEEQIRSLKYFISLWGDSDGQLKYAKIFNDVISLCEQLKKLM